MIPELGGGKVQATPSREEEGPSIHREPVKVIKGDVPDHLLGLSDKGEVVKV